MDIRTGISLKNYTTMKLGGEARFMAIAHTAKDVQAIYTNAKKQNIPVFVLGGGSNVIAHDEGYGGIVLRNSIKGFEVLADDKSSAIIKVGSGESWDEIVKMTVDMNLTGIEAMSGIPGTMGAAPVQNIGAYGQELADTFVSLEAYDSIDDRMVTLEAEECGFSYRHSIFRAVAANRYCITSIVLRLYHAPPKPPFYAGLQKYLDDHAVTMYTPAIIRDAVLAIRAEKLPDPRERPNTGSFFKNAIIQTWQLQEIQKEYPDMPFYDMSGGYYKIPTGWLIETANMKGKLLHGIRVHNKNALVLINESASSYAHLDAARNEIMQAVYDLFRITIEQEPLEI